MILYTWAAVSRSTQRPQLQGSVRAMPPEPTTMFDLEKTAAVDSLLQIPAAQRNLDWVRKLFSAIPDASLRSSKPEIMTGPDGFNYFVLALPDPDQPFEPYCLNYILPRCLEEGIGIVLNPTADKADFVWTFGHLWSFQNLGLFDRNLIAPSPPPTAAGTEPSEQKERKVKITPPTDDSVPPFARKALAQFLKTRVGHPAPALLLMQDEEAKPTENFVFNIFQENFEKPEHFNMTLQGLRWFLPPHFGLAAVPQGSEVSKYFVPIGG